MQVTHRQAEQVDRTIERRQHHADFVRHHPEYLASEIEAMRATLNEAERRALTRRFTGAALTDFGALA